VALSLEALSFLERADESLAGAEAALGAGRVNNAANRAYFACFQAAVAALIANGVSSRRPEQWSHDDVQARFANELVRRRKRYPAEFAGVLDQLRAIRRAADYSTAGVSSSRATTALRLARRFVAEIRRQEGA
jgi:uncharacterized protein (UPF0332 family)